ETVGADGSYDGTTSALFYGFKTNGVVLCPQPLPPAWTSSAYAGSESIFRLTPPISANSTSFLAFMITATNLAFAKIVVDQGVASDGTFPTQTVFLSKSDDVDRNVRYQLFDNAVFNTRLRGNYSVQRISANDLCCLGNLLG